MKVPIEIAAKVEAYEKATAEAKENFKAVVAWLNEHTDADGSFIGHLFIASAPTGVYQGDGEWCNQWPKYGGEYHSGHYFHQIEDSDKYLGYAYEC